MKNNEIFLKAQDKAIKNGFITFPEGFEFDLKLKSSNYDSTLFFTKNHPLINTIIFSHDFAKAFWGKDETCFHCHGDSKDWIEGTCPECFCNPKYRSKWKFNLQQMVIEKEPIKYLEKFL